MPTPDCAAAILKTAYEKMDQVSKYISDIQPAAVIEINIIAMCANNTPVGLSVLAECTTDVRQWYLQNGLQLNPDTV